MTAHAREKARKTGDFLCANCGAKVHVSNGKKIPRCPNCGNDTFDERRNEPSNPSTSGKDSG